MSTADDVIDEPNPDRRRFLNQAATVVSGVGIAFAAVPFVSSWSPSERAQAAGAPVEVDITGLREGEMITAEWRGKPVWLVRRTPEMLENLPAVANQLRDPNSAQEQQPAYVDKTTRSIRPDLLVMIGICTHLGCSPLYRPEPGGDLGSDWKGGFFCPCHGSKFDLAGRVYKGVPAPTNMEIPPHRYVKNDTCVLIGVHPEEKA